VAEAPVGFRLDDDIEVEVVAAPLDAAAAPGPIFCIDATSGVMIGTSSCRMST
jgi:hypothetical protein